MRIFLTCLCVIWGALVKADSALDIYFSNDSVNGFQLSDAYETHNMGMRYSSGPHMVSLDLGIVSPDMLVYRNQFRHANRSYGEIATVSYVNALESIPNVTAGLYIKGSGDLGLNKAQAFAHKLFKLAKVDEINELVRMPDQIWFGVIANYKTQPVNENNIVKFNSFQTSVGSDTGSLKFERHYSKEMSKFNLNISYGAEIIPYNYVVSSEPIRANHRKIIPIVAIGIESKIAEMDLYISQRLSLPTISADDSIYAVVTAGVRYNF